MRSSYETVLMGGAGSTGSSLLRTVLNRHKDIFSGEELNFFNKEQYFEDWNRYKKRALAKYKLRMLATKGWFPYPGNSLLYDEYMWTYPELLRLIRTSNSITQFTEEYSKRILDKKGARIWIEKTPSNAYSFRYFLNIFKESKVIHIARNPYDAVASLVRRGMTPYFASGLWLYNTATALSVQSCQRYLLVKYENLVENPENEIAMICEFLGVNFDKQILQPGTKDDQRHTRNIGWTHHRTQKIKKSSESTFNKLTEKEQQEIIFTLSSIKITDKYQKIKKLDHNSCKGICDELKYKYIRPLKKEYYSLLKDYILNVFKRSRKGYPTHIFNYPLKLNILNFEKSDYRK